MACCDMDERERRGRGGLTRVECRERRCSRGKPRPSHATTVAMSASGGSLEQCARRRVCRRLEKAGSASKGASDAIEVLLRLRKVGCAPLWESTRRHVLSISSAPGRGTNARGAPQREVWVGVGGW